MKSRELRKRRARSRSATAHGRSGAIALGIAIAVVAASAVAPDSSLGAASSARVLRVGTYRGIRGDFSSIQDAVDAAMPGDWILIAPGDYHEQGDEKGPGPAAETGAGVLITTPDIHVRGLDRNSVVIDGTKPGSRPCSSSPDAQDFGPLDANGDPVGRNGIVAFEVDGVTIENLTACNFLTKGEGGNQIWFNGGDGTGTVNMGGFGGAYLTATSTYFAGADEPAAEYGIFASNVAGPGTIEHTYASNMADSSYYVGACPDCNVVVSDAHAENSALGYSGTNSGGHLILENSEWDRNPTGISLNSQNNDDAPSPQLGQCPDGGVGPTGTSSCTIIRNNFIHDNNNPNVPQTGSAGLGPVGTGIVLSGGRYDTVIGNRIVNNGAWGVLVVPFIDEGPPPPVAHCEGGEMQSATTCFYDSWGHEVTRNSFDNNGSFGNETNGDLGDVSAEHDPGNCYHDNVDTSETVSSAPGDLQQTHAQCGVPNAGADIASPLAEQVICDTEVFGPCPDQPGMHYPRPTKVTLLPRPQEPTMPDPCKGVPANSWCQPTAPRRLPLLLRH